MRRSITLAALILLGPLVPVAGVAGDDKPAAGKPPAGRPVPLTKSGTVLLDKAGRRVILKTKVVLREGALEMLLCRKGTKEHESILALDAPAFVVHTALLAVGAEPGQPVRFTPEYQPPRGQKIDIFLQWTDAQGKPHRVPAHTWVRSATRRFFVAKLDELPAGLTLPKETELRYDAKHDELLWYGTMTEKQRDELLALSQDEEYRRAIRSLFDQGRIREMKADWVFAGSGYYVEKDDQGKERRYYLAEDGDVICVANFPSAMIDVDVESSASGSENLLYEAYTERIPPTDTEVTVELVPVFDKKTPPKKENEKGE